MNRRNFTLGIAALFGAPKVPLSAIIAPTTASPVMAAKHFKFASMISRAHNNCSPQFLMRHLNIDAQVAGQIQQALISENVITLPSVNGISRAVDPMQYNKLPQAVSNIPSPANTDTTIQDRIKTQMDQKLATDESNDPDHSQEQADDPVPASHGNADEIPSDLVTTRDRGGQDLT